jgi:hypothetical protein
LSHRIRDWLAHAAPALVAIVALATVATGASVAYLRAHSTSAKPSPALSSVRALTDGRGTSHIQVAQPGTTTKAQPAIAVTKLGRLYLPDAAVALPRSVTASQLAAVRRVSGIQGVVTALRGTTTLGGRSVNVLAVNPGSFRAFTPRPTAASDALWQVPARGEAIASYELNKKSELPLGGRLPLGRVPDIRIGALAEFSLPNVDVVVSTARAAAVGATSPVLFVSSPNGDASSLRTSIGRVLGTPVKVTMLRPAFKPVTVTGVGSGGEHLTADTPVDLRTLYMRAAATCPGLPWGVLAGIGQVETDHGRNKAVSTAGAMGPMQFLPSTFAIYGVDGDGDGKANILDQPDAVYTAARYLCASGGGQPDTLYDAIFAYNHSDFYVKTVLGLAAQYK